MVSELVNLGRGTITNLICAGGRQALDWSSDYRVFSKARWEPGGLFGVIRREILGMLEKGSPLVAVMDDTRVKKTGRRIPGVSYFRDPLSPAFHCNLILGQRFLQISALLPSQNELGPARAIPIQYLHSPSVKKPGSKAGAEEWGEYRSRCRVQNLSVDGVQALKNLRAELDQKDGCRDRKLLISVDGSYCNQTVLRSLPERTILIGRIRKDAQLHHFPEESDRSGPGAKIKYGAQAPRPEQIRQDAQIPWQEVKAFACGRWFRFRVKTISPLLWRKAGPELKLRLLVIAPLGYRLRKGSRLLYRQPAYLICTEPGLPLEQLLQYYLWRWDIEINHRDEKQIFGVGQAQVWSENSVARAPAFAVASYAMLLLAGEKACRESGSRLALPPPKWRQNREQPRNSTQDFLRQLRYELWGKTLGRQKMNYQGFALPTRPDTKPKKFKISLASSVLYQIS